MSRPAGTVAVVSGASKGIGALNPGMVKTERLHSASFANSDFRKMSQSKTPLGSTEQPEDIARAAVFFASEDAGWVTGQTLVVAGGQRQ